MQGAIVLLLRTIVGLLAILLLAIFGSANAAGLGKLVVFSALGEPLHAEIDLLSIGDATAAGLRPRLASPVAYRVADYRYNPAFASAHLVIKQEANGRHYIELSSRQPLYEPYVQLLIELDWNGIRIVRGYTVLIDPHGYGTPVAPLAEWLPTSHPAVRVQSVAVSPVAGIQNSSVRPARDPLMARAPTVAVRTDRMGRVTLLEDQAKTNAKTLAGLLARVDVLEQYMQRLQRQAAPASLPKPAATAAPARNTVAAPARDAAVAPQAATIGQKLPAPAVPAPAVQPVVPPPMAQVPAAVAEPQPKPPVVGAPSAVAGRSDSPLNVALLVLAGGSLILLFSLAYWMSRRPQLTEVTTEDMLEKLLARNPQRDDVLLKLLEIYAARGDRTAYQNMAGRLYVLSGGQGDAWIKVASKGFELDPGNPLYEAGKYLAIVDSVSDSANAVRH